MTSLPARVANILKSPKTEWPVIAAEPEEVGSLYTGYIMPLAAIPAICTFLGFALVGMSVPLVGRVRIGMGTGLTRLVVGYVMSLVSVYVAALVIEWLAPRFKSSGSRLDALKLVAYASTPVWVAGVLNLVPALGVLGLLAALYGIYLFYLGVTPLMKTPADQVVPYMVVSAVAIVVVYVVIGVLVGVIAPMGHMGVTL